MKIILYITLTSLLFLDFVIGQEIDTSFKRIETGNWLELSYRPLNEEGKELPFLCVEEFPEIPGGFDALAKFITDTLKYPTSALRDSVQGRVMTKFIVNKNGKVTNVETFKGVRRDLDSVCVWAISKLPNWSKPKSKYYNNISIQFILPIRFIISKD